MEGAGSSTKFLRTLIEAEGGSISVARFMQEALYHPVFGYYSRKVATVGRGGDFSTSATLHPALGQALAAWALDRRSEVAWMDRHWHVIELGGGTGELADSLLRALGWWARRKLRYHVVEVSETLRAQQQKRLAAFRNVSWHTNMHQALTAAGGSALVFSNEFVDAFPCHQLRWDGVMAVWQEVRVAWPPNASSPSEVFVPWEGTSPTFALRGTKSQRIEIHGSYQTWLQDCLPQWKAGRWLTIDYGGEMPGIYHRQPHGTLRAYCRHQRYAGLEVYQRFGLQDLTADVNFTDLQAWGAAAGLTTIHFETQAEFLQKWLPEKVLRRKDDTRLNFLRDPGGAGGAFKVLEQEAGGCSAQNAA